MREYLLSVGKSGEREWVKAYSADEAKKAFVQMMSLRGIPLMGTSGILVVSQR